MGSGNKAAGYAWTATVVLPDGRGDYAPCPELLTEEEAIRYLRLNEIKGVNPKSTLRYYRRSRRSTLMAMAQRYLELFSDDEGRIPATFQIIYLTAWAPHPDQQQSLKPGSATSRLAKALDADEIAAGEKAKP